MLVTVFCFLLFNAVEQTNADDVQNIPLTLYIEKVNGTSYLKCNASENYTLLENEMAEMIVDYNNYINIGSCYYSGNEFEQYVNASNSAGPLHKTKFKVHKKLSNRWNCTFLTNRDVKMIRPEVIRNEHSYTQVNCTFYVHVRRIKSPVTIKVNNIALNTTRTDLSVSEYDAVGYYDYEAGERVRVVCEKNLNDTSHGSLEYNIYRNKDETVFKSSVSYGNDTSFDITLKSEHNNGYWDCIYTKIYSRNRDRNVLRIYLTLQTEKHKLLQVQVNGETQIPTTISGRDESIYKYRSDAQLIVICEKISNVDGCLVLRNGNGFITRNNTIPNDCNESTISAALKLEERDTNSELECVLTSKGLDVKTYTIKFVYADIYNVTVEGLNKAKVILENDVDRELVRVIHYEFTAGDTLHLNCLTKHTYEFGAKCYFSMDGVLSSKSNASMNEPVISATYKLDKSNDNAIIKCECRTVKTSERPETAIGETRIKLLYKDVNHPDSNGTEIGGEDELWQWVRIIGIAVVSLIIIVIIICAIVSRIRKTRIADEPTDISYENLPHHSEGRSAPLPEQWNDDFRTRSTVQEAPGYSVPYTQDNDSALYATPVPKNARKIESIAAQLAFESAKKGNDYANSDPLYADIGNKGNVATTAGDDNYAQVLPKSLRNKTVDDKGEYSNVFNDERYVNADTQEYAEPAYCAMNFKPTSNKHK